ncbi:zinc ribbon domain-containing protein [Streptomyces incanus]|uniref:Zinc ribbon domain-containing protein n=1 Tax=Streptomyces incanus TaxID=887453 RepID=A0ABW0XFH0_9ACTN
MIAKHGAAEAERPSRARPGRSHGHPAEGTASQAPTGHPALPGVPPTRAVHRVQSPQGGVPVVYVDPTYTTRTCAECGHIDRANKVSQARFACRSCGFVDHADRNGSRDIRARARELWRRGVPSTAPAPPPVRARRAGAGRRRGVTPSDVRCASPSLQ